MKVRMSTTDPWPNPSEVFALEVFGQSVPLLLIAIMTFILITSSGTMALAVNMGYRKDKKTTFWLMVATAMLGASFVGMQAFEWTRSVSTMTALHCKYNHQLDWIRGDLMARRLVVQYRFHF